MDEKGPKKGTFWLKSEFAAVSQNWFITFF